MTSRACASGIRSRAICSSIVTPPGPRRPRRPRPAPPGWAGRPCPRGWWWRARRRRPPGASARGRSRPSRCPLIRPAAKPSPAPTVSTTRTGKTGWSMRALGGVRARAVRPVLDHDTGRAPLQVEGGDAVGVGAPVSRCPSVSPGSTQSARAAISLITSHHLLRAAPTASGAGSGRRRRWRPRPRATSTARNAKSRALADRASGIPVTCRCRAAAT